MDDHHPPHGDRRRYFKKMSHNTYLIVSAILFGGSLIASCVAVFFFLMAAIRWRGPNCRKFLIRGSFLMLLAPLLITGQLGIAHLIYLPSIGEYQEPPADEMNDGFYTSIGDFAPPFIITDDGGSIVDIAALRGSVVLLDFFGIDCVPCVREMPHIQKLFDRLRDRSDFQVIAITEFDTPDAVSAFKSEHGLSFPIAVDSTRKIRNLYASLAVPRTYVIARDGRVAYQVLGFADGTSDLVAIETAIQAELDRTAN